LRIVPFGESHTGNVRLNSKRKGGPNITLLKIKLLDSCFVWRDCSAFDTNRVLLDCFCCIKCDLVICLIPISKALKISELLEAVYRCRGGSHQVVVLQVDIEISKDGSEGRRLINGLSGLRMYQLIRYDISSRISHLLLIHTLSLISFHMILVI
jgi:hypothetical protein